jgi:predicted SAM-dependent methyltransferase
MLEGLENVKLHVGCGGTKMNGFINIDMRQTPATDLVVDLNLPIPFESIECAFSNAFFEHLYRDKRITHLTDLYNKLTSTGFVCYIGIPYFKNIAKFYLDNVPGTAGPVFDLYNVYRYTHGDPENVLPDNYLAQLHKSLFDERELMQLLGKAGFTNYAIFCYGFPGDYVELPVTMGFFAMKQKEHKDFTGQICRNFLKNLDGVYLRMNTLQFLQA